MIYRFALLCAFAFFLSNCTKMNFSPIKKQEALKSDILEDDGGSDPGDGGGPIAGGNDTGGDGDGDDNDTGRDGDGDGNDTGGDGTGDGDGGGDGIADPEDDTNDDDEDDDYDDSTDVPGDTSTLFPFDGADVDYLCSDSRSAKKGTVRTASSLTLQLYKKSKNDGETVYCTESDTNYIRQSVATQKRLKFRNCQVAAGKYRIRLLNEKGQDLSVKDRAVVIDADLIKTKRVDVLMDSNPDANNKDAPAFQGTACDKKASPLFVDLRRDGDPTNILSSPEDGVKFDILGANGTPAYSKQQISWFKRGRLAMLTLPKEGKVLGIDQLFGDNTLGLDGQFAANGFAALAKHDSNGDNVIDGFDAVFSKLRLWLDENRDGVAESDELKSLMDARITAIDLQFDPNYSETDKYGNEIKYKSVVKFSNGNLRSIFDVWFVLR